MTTMSCEISLARYLGLSYRNRSSHLHLSILHLITLRDDINKSITLENSVLRKIKGHKFNTRNRTKIENKFPL